MDFRPTSLLDRYIRMKGIKCCVNDLSVNVHEIETFLQDLKSLVKKLDEHIQLYRIHPADEYSVLTYAEWAEFNGNHVQPIG